MRTERKQKLKRRLLHCIKLIMIVFVFGVMCCCKNQKIFGSSISELIAIDKEHIIFETTEGFIIKTDTNDQSIWQHKKQHELSLALFDSGNSILYTTPGTVVSLNKDNGTINFILEDSFTVRTSEFLSYQNEIIALSQYGVYSFSRDSGAISWSLVPKSSTQLADPKAIIQNNTLFIAGNFKSDTQTTLYAYDLINKQEIKAIDLPKTIVTNIVICNDQLIFGVGQSVLGRELIAIDTSSLEIQWQLAQDINHSAFLICDNNDNLFFNFKDQVFKLDIQTKSAEALYQLPNDYYELYDIMDNRIFAHNNSSISIFSLEQNTAKHHRNIMTSGIWTFDEEIYFADHTTLKTVQDLE